MATTIVLLWMVGTIAFAVALLIVYQPEKGDR
jgi:hypothetical protein